MKTMTHFANTPPIFTGIETWVSFTNADLNSPFRLEPLSESNP